MKINSSTWQLNASVSPLMTWGILHFLCGATAFSQGHGGLPEKELLPSSSTRQYGGWIASPKQDPISPATHLLSPHEENTVQHASYFQTQGLGGFPPPPVYPPSAGEDVNAQSGLRRRNDPVPPTSNSVGAGMQAPGQFETGLPFVTQAPIPQSNPGRYPTSPYMGPRVAVPYQNAGYQRVIPGQRASAPVAAQAGALPQYQVASFPNPVFSNNPTPGIYPTSYQQCQVLPPPSLPPDGLPGQTYIPPTFTPNWNPNLYSTNNVGHKPLFTLGQENYNVVLGRGIIGQPKAYVPGQWVRNFLRYLTP